MWNRLVGLIKFLLRWAMLQISLFLRFLLPRLLTFSGLAARLVVATAVLWLRGVWTAVGELTLWQQKEEIRMNPFRNPGPSNFVPVFKILAYCVVIGELMVGWIGAAFLTVWIVELVVALIF